MSLTRLTALAAQGERIVVGLNSGTSMDAIDALCVKVLGAGPEVRVEALGFAMIPYPDEVREILLQAPNLSLADVAWLDVRLGQLFGDAVAHAAERAGLSVAEVELIGSHGQTVFHAGRQSPKGPASLQIGSLDVIAERTGAVVIGDFRSRDIAAGGAGAPLMPYLDWIMFRERPRTVCLNLGGIAAVTAVSEELDDCISFDVGPGNIALDILATRLTQGEESYDPGGRLAAEGHVDAILLDRLLAHPFLHSEPPKSAGRKDFGLAFVEKILAQSEHLALQDILATLCRFVAQSITWSIKEHLAIDGGPRELVISGGGVRNVTILHHLRQLLSPVPVTTLDSYGYDPDAKEALLFALLANEGLAGGATNIPRSTGARWPVPLGHIVF